MAPSFNRRIQGDYETWSQVESRNSTLQGIDNVEFLKGYIEAIPLPAHDRRVISNCVINLAADKPAVFAEMFRVLKPGGRVGVSDVVSDDELSRQQRAQRGSYVALKGR